IEATATPTLGARIKKRPRAPALKPTAIQMGAKNPTLPSASPRATAMAMTYDRRASDEPRRPRAANRLERLGDDEAGGRRRNSRHCRLTSLVPNAIGFVYRNARLDDSRRRLAVR